jgi:hypothetical protein
LLAEADQVVMYNDATFNKKWAGINSIGGTIGITAFGAWEIYKIVTAQNDNDRIFYGSSALFSFVVCLPICLWSVYRFSKNCSNAEKATKISEVLYAAKARLK